MCSVLKACQTLTISPMGGVRAVIYGYAMYSLVNWPPFYSSQGGSYFAFFQGFSPFFPLPEFVPPNSLWFFGSLQNLADWSVPQDMKFTGM